MNRNHGGPWQTCSARRPREQEPPVIGAVAARVLLEAFTEPTRQISNLTEIQDRLFLDLCRT